MCPSGVEWSVSAADREFRRPAVKERTRARKRGEKEKIQFDGRSAARTDDCQPLRLLFACKTFLPTAPYIAFPRTSLQPRPRCRVSSLASPRPTPAQLANPIQPKNASQLPLIEWRNGMKRMTTPIRQPRRHATPTPMPRLNTMHRHRQIPD